MDKVRVNDVELEYEERGSGEPVLLIPTGPIADSFRPLVVDDELAGRYRMITYHRRGQAGSTHSPGPVSFADQAADAAMLLEHLAVRRAHVAGHSTGGIVALQLAADRPDLMHTLMLLEPTLLAVPSAAAFMEQAAPIFAAYGSGDRDGAMASFISAVCGLSWQDCSGLIDRHVPGGVEQALEAADTFFGIDLPAHSDWALGPEQVSRITGPVLSVLGSESAGVFAEGRQLLHGWFGDVEDCTVEGAGHLLHMQNPGPVLRGIAAFLARHPMTERRDGAARSQTTGLAGSVPTIA